MQSEYNAESRVEPQPWTLSRWWRTRQGAGEQGTIWPSGSALARDPDGGRMVLLVEEWQLRYFQERNAHIEISAVPFAPTSVAERTGSPPLGEPAQ
jgi:peptide subunit release factor RF-3